MRREPDELDLLVEAIRDLPERDRVPAVDMIRRMVAAATRKPPTKSRVRPPVAPSPTWISVRDTEF